MLKLREAIQKKISLWDELIGKAKSDKVAMALLRDKRRWLCRNDLFYLGLLTGHTKFIDPFHRYLCEHVSLMNWQVILKGIMPRTEDLMPMEEICDEPEKDLGKAIRLYLLFRSAFKTTISTKLHTAQLLLNFPDIHVAISHNTQINASDNLESVKNLFLMTALKDLFPEYIPKGVDWGNKTGFSVDNRKDFTLTGDNVEAIGIGTEVTGRKYHVFKNDDIVTEKSVTNEEQLRQSRDFLELHKSLFVNPSVRVEDYSGTKYHFADAYSVLQEDPTVDKLIQKVLNEFPAGEIEWQGKRYNRAVPEMFSVEGIKDLMKDAYIFNCNPYEAPIWMADGIFKPIGEIQVGDEVIGFNDYMQNKRRKLVKTKVLAIGNRIASVQKVFIDNGDIIRCTPDHKWFKGRSNEVLRKEYDVAKIGCIMIKVITIPDRQLSEEEIYNWSYLASMIDGEGSCGYGSIAIHQSLEKNPEVCEKIKYTLERLFIKYNIFINKQHGIHKKAISYLLATDRQFRIDLLHYGRPAKRKQIIDILLKHGANFCEEKPKVIKIIPDGKEPVYSMQTETGNYICWGYASKNCQYMLSPEDPKKVKFTKEMIETFTHIPDGLNYYLVVDPADSEEKRACYTAMKVLGVDKEDNWYWVDGLFDKIDDRERIDDALQLAKKWRVFEVLWENTSFGRTDNRNFERASEQVSREERTWMVRPIPASRISKDDRILGLNDRYSRHKIFWPAKLLYYSRFEGKTIDIVDAQRYEFLGFPLVSHKDLLDAESFLLQIDLIRGKAEPVPMADDLAKIKDHQSRGATAVFRRDWADWKANNFREPVEAFFDDGL